MDRLSQDKDVTAILETLDGHNSLLEAGIGKAHEVIVSPTTCRAEKRFACRTVAHLVSLRSLANVRAREKQLFGRHL